MNVGNTGTGDTAQAAGQAPVYPLGEWLYPGDVVVYTGSAPRPGDGTPLPAPGERGRVTQTRNQINPTVEWDGGVVSDFHVSAIDMLLVEPVGPRPLPGQAMEVEFYTITTTEGRGGLPYRWEERAVRVVEQWLTATVDRLAQSLAEEELLAYRHRHCRGEEGNCDAEAGCGNDWRQHDVCECWECAQHADLRMMLNLKVMEVHGMVLAFVDRLMGWDKTLGLRLRRHAKQEAMRRADLWSTSPW